MHTKTIQLNPQNSTLPKNLIALNVLYSHLIGERVLRVWFHIKQLMRARCLTSNTLQFLISLFSLFFIFPLHFRNKISIPP